MVASKGLPSLLTGHTTPFGEALDWLQFTYTTDLTGAYVVPVSTFFVQYGVVEGVRVVDPFPVPE